MESNPIQQRAEEFELKYLEVSYSEEYKYLVFRTTQEDVEMIEAFYEYMLGMDNEIEDVVLLFQSILYQSDTYSKALVEELFTTTFLWNYADKPEGIEDNQVNWEMDLSLTTDKNVASLFVSHINAFCEAVEFEAYSNLVCVLDYQNTKAQPMLQWLEDLEKLDLHPKVRIVLSDTFEQPIFNDLVKFAPRATRILEHRFSLNRAMKEIAAIGDPKAPDTKYRYHLIQLYEAISKRHEKNITKHATLCLDIAEKNQAKDANWSVQKMFIYGALSAHAFGKKIYKEAVLYINQGIDVLKKVEGALPEEMLYRLLGQAYLFRGNLFLTLKKYRNAKEDFLSGEIYYKGCQDSILEIEALRLLAVAADKDGDRTVKYEALNKGVRLGENLTIPLVEASTYKLLIKDVLASKYSSYVSDKELDEIISPLLGEQWRAKTKNIKNIMFNKDEL